MTICLYMRMSTNMQEHSIKSQRQVLTAYAKSHNMKIAAEYIDEGISGRKAEKRPGFMQMMEDSATDSFSAVLIYDSSRFARNLEESIVYKSILKRNGVSIVSATEPNLDSESSILTDALFGAMNEMYSIRLSKNVRRGMVHNAQNGVYQCSPPHGYAIPIKKQPPIVVPHEAALVRRIFDIYPVQLSAFRIARELNAEGHRTRSGKQWEARHIERILTNPIYKGEIAWNKVTANNGRTNDQSDWIVAQGKHEAIISAEQFDKVQMRMAANKKTKHARPPGTYKHWLTGIIKCSACGASLTYGHSNRGTSNFNCNRYKKGTCTTCNSISQAKAEKYLFQALEAISVGENLDYEYVRRDMLETQENQRIETAITRLGKKLDRAREAYENGVDTLTEYKGRKEAINSEIEVLRRQILQTANVAAITMNERRKAQKNIGMLCMDLRDDSKSIDEKNTALRMVLEKIVYDAKQGIFEAFIIC